VNESEKGGAAVPGEDLGGRRGFRLPRGIRLFGPLLGLVFLVYPVRAVLASAPTPAGVLLALGGAGLFAGVFLWLVWTHEPLSSGARDLYEVRKRWAAIAFLAALAVALNLSLGVEWRVLFFHANVAAGMMLPTRGAYAAIAGLAVLTLALGVSSGMAWLVLPTAVLGLWATAFVRQVATVAELRAAREELARLAVSEERLRFARDLHDLLGHSLSLITLKSELAGRLLPSEPGGRRRRSGTSKGSRARPYARCARPWPATGSPRSKTSSRAPARCWGPLASPAGPRTGPECCQARRTPPSPGLCARVRRT
jgi:two-component system sensor histidine kinase DesK